MRPLGRIRQCRKGVSKVFQKNSLRNGISSLSVFLIIVLGMLIADPLVGVLAVRAEDVTQEQMAALEEQEAAAREKQAAALRQQEEAKRLQAEEALRAAFRASGTGFDLNAIPETTLALAQRIQGATPLDERSALAAAVYARKFNLRPSLLVAVISKESNFHQFSVGSHQDRGYMQIIPSTERFMMRSYGGALGLKYNPKQIFDPEYNLGLGAAYLSGMLNEYGDVHRILTEYNRGEGGARSYYRRNGTYSTSYSRKVLDLEQQYLSLN